MMRPFDKIKEMGGFAQTTIENRFGGDTKTGTFFRTVKNRMGIGSPERNATDTYEREMAIVPQCISANENEIPVKQYNIAVLRNLLKFERAEGRIQVTNKRVIFRAAGRSVVGRTTLQHEFAIDKIAGIEANNNYKFSFLHLIFAILIIVAGFFVIYRPPITGIVSPISSQSARISGIMFPKHLQKAFENERTAIYQTRQAEANVSEAAGKVKQAYEKEETAGINVRNGIQRTRRVQSGTTWWGEPQYTTETFRDRTPAGLLEAQNVLDAAIDERENAEAVEQRFVAELETAKDNEAKMTKRRENTVAIWKVLMTLLGLVLGIGGLIPFFVLYKKFDLKLFILNFSIFGFALSLAASEIKIFNFLLLVSCITAIVCIFLYCFRPNLILSIKNKGGLEAAVNIRRDTLFTKSSETGTGFSEVFPTKETESAIREIGAMINDIQKLGDLGIEKWKQ